MCAYGPVAEEIMTRYGNVISIPFVYRYILYTRRRTKVCIFDSNGQRIYYYSYTVNTRICEFIIKKKISF